MLETSSSSSCTDNRNSCYGRACVLAFCGSQFFLLADVDPVRANCVHGAVNTACDSSPPNPFTATIGSGNNAGMDNRTATIGNGAVVATGNASAISLRDNNTVTVQTDGTVRNAASSGAGNYGAGRNTIEFHNGGMLIVEQGGQVLSQGTQGSAEAVNLMGTGNTIINSGTIAATNAAAIWFESGTATNTIINNQTGIIRAPGNVIGSSGNASVNFSNRGRVEGNLVFAGGNDTLRLFTGSVITGNNRAMPSSVAFSTIQSSRAFFTGAKQSQRSGTTSIGRVRRSIVTVSARRAVSDTMPSHSPLTLSQSSSGSPTFARITLSR